MTHEELHEDAVVILSLLSDRINFCIEGNTHIIVDLLSVAIKHNPMLKDVMLAAIEMTGLEDNDFSPELN